MGKDGKSMFFVHSIRHFYQTQKKNDLMVPNFIFNHKTDFSRVVTNIFKIQGFSIHIEKNYEIFFFLKIYCTAALIKKKLK